ncbi:hypothetical protein VTK73DRAFT_6346 [Phialemonium thermophilum]|uniref:Uncharacterized protein n=1 Tax=Phialemonium thermophilum TaxID=223376 RepID=A0ABR3WJZ8_9PEZI
MGTEEDTRTAFKVVQASPAGSPGWHCQGSVNHARVPHRRASQSRGRRSYGAAPLGKVQRRLLVRPRRAGSVAGQEVFSDVTAVEEVVEIEASLKQLQLVSLKARDENA